MAGIYYRPQFYSYGMKSPYITDPRMISPYTTSPERLDAIPVFKPHITVLSHHSNGLDVDSIKILVEGFGVDNGDIVMIDGRVYSPEEFITCLYVKSNLYIGTDDKHRDCFATFKPGDRISHRILNYEDMIQGNRLKIEIEVDLAKPCKYQWMTSKGYIGVEEEVIKSLIIVCPDFSEMFTIDCDETLFYDGHGKPYGAQTYKAKRPVILYDIHGVRLTETNKVNNTIKEETPIEIRDILLLKNDVAEGFEPITKKFKIISYIEKVGEIPIDSYIMKQVEGPVSTIFSLTKYDCKELGIQYEKGLQLFPKNLNWINPNATPIEKDNSKSSTSDMKWAYNPMTQCLEVSTEDGKLNKTFTIDTKHIVSKWETLGLEATKDVNKIKLVLEKKNDPIFSYYHMKQNGKKFGKIIVHRCHLLQSVSYDDNRQQYVFSVKDTYGRTFEAFFSKNEIENRIINL